MVQADRVHSTPPLNVSAISLLTPPRQLTMPLTPQDVLADLFDERDDVIAPFPERSAEVVVERLIDAGFEIRPARSCPARDLLERCISNPFVRDAMPMRLVEDIEAFFANDRS
jgi:hypothetical protein